MSTDQGTKSPQGSPKYPGAGRDPVKPKPSDSKKSVKRVTSEFYEEKM